MRAFVAIDLPDEVRAALEAVQDHLRVGRLADSETFHVTLAFLDDQPVSVLEELHAGLGAIRSAAFTLQLRGLGTFGGKAPRVIWAGLEPEPALLHLRDRVRGAARVVGIDLPRERFRPHVTLARFQGRLEGEEIAKLIRFLERSEQFPCPPFAVTTFTLFRSILHSDGAFHDPLAEYDLAGNSPD